MSNRQNSYHPYAYSQAAHRGLNHLKVGGKPLNWSGLVFLYRQGKISEEMAEQVRKKLAKTIKAAGKGFKGADVQAHLLATGQIGPKADAKQAVRQKQMSENERRIAELEARIAAMAAAKDEPEAEGAEVLGSLTLDGEATVVYRVTHPEFGCQALDGCHVGWEEDNRSVVYWLGEDEAEAGYCRDHLGLADEDLPKFDALIS